MCDSVILKKRIWALILSVLGFSTALFFSPQVFGHNAFNVGLSRFEAIPAESGVRLEWDVETEIGTAGYTIKRGESGNFDYLIDPQTDGKLFIVSEGGPTQGFNYSFVDESAVLTATYTYQLIEITAGSSEQVQDEVTVTYQTEAFTTPVTFSGDIGGNQENNVATATPAATQPAAASTTVPSSATTAPPPTVKAPTPLPGDTADAPTAQANAAPGPLATVATQQEPYPADSPEASEIQNETAGDSPTTPVNEAQEVDSEGAADTGTSLNELTADSNPGAANALEAPAGEQPTLINDVTSPVVIGGATGGALDSPYPGQTEEQIEYEEPTNADSTRILLWLAFLVALIIFTASVVGAILLYSKQRSVN